jgi:4-hydroxy-tetrahydrodipicolinate reductase
LKLKEIVAKNIEKNFNVSATRAGHIPGTHRVGFDGAADQILLEHAARSREGFRIGRNYGGGMDCRAQKVFMNLRT